MWWSLALLSALASLARNIVMKDLGHKLDEYVNVLGRFIFILPFALVLSLYHGIPQTNTFFWIVSILGGLFVAISTMYLSKALKYSHISLTIALWKLNIIFALILEIFLLNAKIAPLGIFGVLITVLGMYLLNIKKAKVSLWKPFTMLLEDKGMRYAVLSALLLAPTFMFFKVLVDMTDPYFPAFTIYVFATLFTLPVVLKMSKGSYLSYVKHWKGFLAMGFFAFLTTVLATIAYADSFATFVEAVKQSEVLFALLAGVLFFKEHQRVKDIWIGCCVILIGISLIIISK